MAFYHSTEARHAKPRFNPVRQALNAAISRAIPDNTSVDEFSQPLLFVLSIQLNRLTGGAAQMTFSARCHCSANTARHRPVRLIWHGIGAAIDVYCARFRGETCHCATAWANHMRRR